eukprot:COSAG05_NODE_10_length_39559_cov_64.255423_14_plen_289_part_00
MLIGRNCDWAHCRGAWQATSGDREGTTAAPLQPSPSTLPPGNRHRFAVSWSHDGGSSWGPLVYQPDLVTPTCQASLISYQGPHDAAPALYFAGPYSESSAAGHRLNGTILASDDSGRSFTRALTLGPTDDGSMSFGYTGLTCGLINAADGSDCAVVFRVELGGRFGAGIRFKRFKSWQVKTDDETTLHGVAAGSGEMELLVDSSKQGGSLHDAVATAAVLPASQRASEPRCTSRTASTRSRSLSCSMLDTPAHASSVTARSSSPAVLRSGRRSTLTVGRQCSKALLDE